MSNSESMYKEFPLFNSISNPSHRAWNRLNIINNLKSARRGRDAANYLDKLDEAGKLGIAILLMSIKKRGLESVRAELGRSLDEVSCNS
jgi:hypothetical protein